MLPWWGIIGCSIIDHLTGKFTKVAPFVHSQSTKTFSRPLWIKQKWNTEVFENFSPQPLTYKYYEGPA